MKQTIRHSFTLLIILLATACDKPVDKTTESQSNIAQQDTEALLAGFSKAAAEANQRGPVMVNRNTRWDKTELGPGLKLNYFYSFPEHASTDLEPETLDKIVKPDILASVCNSPEMKLTLNSGAIYNYIYSGNDGKEIGRFEIKGQDCD